MQNKKNQINFPKFARSQTPSLSHTFLDTTHTNTGLHNAWGSLCKNVKLWSIIQQEANHSWWCHCTGNYFSSNVYKWDTPLLLASLEPSTIEPCRNTHPSEVCTIPRLNKCLWYTQHHLVTNLHFLKYYLQMVSRVDLTPT